MTEWWQWMIVGLFVLATGRLVSGLLYLRWVCFVGGIVGLADKLTGVDR